MDTCLHLATRRKDSDMVKLFIENGANVDSVNRDGQTILHIASLNGDENIIRYKMESTSRRLETYNLSSGIASFA